MIIWLSFSRRSAKGCLPRWSLRVSAICGCALRLEIPSYSPIALETWRRGNDRRKREQEILPKHLPWSTCFQASVEKGGSYGKGIYIFYYSIILLSDSSVWGSPGRTIEFREDASVSTFSVSVLSVSEHLPWSTCFQASVEKGGSYGKGI